MLQFVYIYEEYLNIHRKIVSGFLNNEDEAKLMLT